VKENSIAFFPLPFFSISHFLPTLPCSSLFFAGYTMSSSSSSPRSWSLLDSENDSDAELFDCLDLMASSGDENENDVQSESKEALSPASLPSSSSPINLINESHYSCLTANLERMLDENDASEEDLASSSSSSSSSSSPVVLDASEEKDNSDIHPIEENVSSPTVSDVPALIDASLTSTLLFDIRPCSPARHALLCGDDGATKNDSSNAPVVCRSVSPPVPDEEPPSPPTLATYVRAAVDEQEASEGPDGRLYKSYQVSVPVDPTLLPVDVHTSPPMPLLVSAFDTPHMDRVRTAIDGPRLRALLKFIGYDFLSTSIVSPNLLMAGGSMQQLADHEHNPNPAQLRTLIQVRGPLGCALASACLVPPFHPAR
jgi:hypothetical protein